MIGGPPDRGATAFNRRDIVRPIGGGRPAGGAGETGRRSEEGGGGGDGRRAIN